MTHRSAVTRKKPGIRIIHQDAVITACSERESILPQEIIFSGSPTPIKLRVDSAVMAFRMFMTIMNKIEGRKVWRQMLPQNVEEAGSHGTCGGDVSAAADLADFGADDFCDSGPAGQTDDEGETSGWWPLPVSPEAGG